MNAPHALALLLRHYGVQRVYRDITGAPRRASFESLLAVLRSLGEPVHGEADLAGAAAEVERRTLAEWAPPVAVAWDGTTFDLALTLPAAQADAPVEVLAAGRAADVVECGACALSGLHGGALVRRLTVTANLPLGGHEVRVRCAGREAAVLVLAAPRHAPQTGAGGAGVFLPLHALRHARDLGVGDYEALGRLGELAGGLGLRATGTLPLLAVPRGAEPGPSPYAPASRLFWNEAFLDVESVPELAASPAARALLDRPDVQAARAALRAAPESDQAAAWRWKRAVLELLAGALVETPARAAAFDEHVSSHPELHDWMRYRALEDEFARPWQDWPAPERDRTADSRAGDPRIARLFGYAQWLCAGQLGAAAARARAAGNLLYLDLPVGAHPSGYDAWRHRELFARDAAAGAPPDPFFSKGQDWGFAPFHPRALRADRYRHWRAVVRHHVQHAGMLRIDHVMGLHRMYFVPRGVPATDGVYVKFPHEELWAAALLEAHQAQCAIVGEDLGTVPPAVRATMGEHGVWRMYVLQFAVAPAAEPAVAVPGADMLATINTHDTPTFAGWWQSRDLDDCLALGTLDPAACERVHAERDAQRSALVTHLQQLGLLPGEPAPERVLGAALDWLAHTPARFVLANLEDLWLEPLPQNVPGTFHERPNWRRRAARTLEELERDPGLHDWLRSLASARAGHDARGPGG